MRPKERNLGNVKEGTDVQDTEIKIHEIRNLITYRREGKGLGMRKLNGDSHFNSRFLEKLWYLLAKLRKSELNSN